MFSECNKLFKCLTVNEALASSVRRIRLEIITSQLWVSFSTYSFKDSISFKMTFELLFTASFVPTCRINLFGFFLSIGLKKSFMSSTVAPGNVLTLTRSFLKTSGFLLSHSTSSLLQLQLYFLYTTLLCCGELISFVFFDSGLV